MTETKKNLSKRFRPLYFSAFFHGFVLWYAIEKIFMKTIGFNDVTIGVMIAFYSAIVLVAETPSGILADRWSRKGVLIIASIFLSLSALIGGLSQGVLSYLVAAGFWGVFFALYSGTYETIVYDTVREETKSGDLYEHYYGKVTIFDSSALVIGSIIGGLVANFAGLNMAYFLSVPMGIGSIAALMQFKEPQLHKNHAPVSLREQVSDTFRSVLQKGDLPPVLVVLVATSALTFLIFEFSQLWTIALLIPLIWFGPVNALHLSSIGIGGALVSRFRLNRQAALMGLLVVLVVSCLALTLSRNKLVVVFAIFFASICLISISIIFSKLLHDRLDSKVRAGAASAISTLGRMIIIPVSIVFGYISSKTREQIITPQYIVDVIYPVAKAGSNIFGKFGVWAKNPNYLAVIEN